MKLILRNIKFYGYHGVYQEEKKLGQQFAVDAELFWKAENILDEISKTIDYQNVFNLIKKTGEEKKYNLIESLAEEIARTLFLDFPILYKVTIRVRKLNPPLKGIIDYVEVEISRTRNNTSTHRKKNSSKPSF